MAAAKKPPSWRSRLKGALTLVRHQAIKRFLSFDNRDLASLLASLGLGQGDVVLVHISYGRFEGYRGTPVDVIEVLQRTVGPSGTIVMPTIPFRGSAVSYARLGKVTDLWRTPSATGLVTEIFRRMPGVVRSIHPTHSVAAWGEHAHALVRDHHLASTPCGKGTPFLRLLDFDGKILFLGASVRAMTFYHGVEELLEPELPESPFTSDTFELQTRDLEGTLWTTRTRLFSQKRRDATLLVPVLRRAGAWHAGRVGIVPVAVVRCADVLQACRDMAKAGRFVYPEN